MGVLNLPQMPKFQTTLPSNGKEVWFRPITYREESFLLQILETKKPEELTSAIVGVIGNCVEGIDVKSLTKVDITWLFIQIRKQSVSELVEYSYRCRQLDKDGKECDTVTPYVINLNDVEIEGKQEITFDVNVTDDTVYTVVFKDCPYNVVTEDAESIDVLYAHLYEIRDKKTGNVYSKEDITKEEFKDLFMLVNIKDVLTLKGEVENIQNIVHKGKWVCSKCGNTLDITTRGLEDFFG